MELSRRTDTVQITHIQPAAVLKEVRTDLWFIYFPS